MGLKVSYFIWLTVLFFCTFLLSFVAAVPKTLSLPNATLCLERKIHVKQLNSAYYFSFMDKETQNLFLNWLDARNWCRERCMDTVSLETLQEIQLIKKYIQLYNVKYVWTSGRLCDFGEKCTERADLQPLNINGWFWSGSGARMKPTDEKSGYNDWSYTGALKKPQPDNREKSQGGLSESCLAYLNNYYSDGLTWHDVTCNHLKSFVCEDNAALRQYAAHTSGLRL